MSTLIDLWLIIIALMVVAGIAFRFLPRRLSPVQLRKVAPAAAAKLVADFIQGSYDGEFGYPSGAFMDIRVTENRVDAREWVAKGSHFVQILGGLYRSIFALGAYFGCFGAFVCLFFAALFTPALLYAALTETLLKYLLRSRIVCTLERAGDGTKIAFSLRGPVAMLVGRRLERAFHEPALPARIASLAGIAAVADAAATAPGTAPGRAA
jgi:hypothetical protein